MVALLHPRGLDALEMPVLLSRVLVVHTINHFVPLPSLLGGIVSSEMNVKRQGANPADGDVGEDDAVTEPVPGFVDRTVLWKYRLTYGAFTDARACSTDAPHSRLRRRSGCPSQ